MLLFLETSEVVEEDEQEVLKEVEERRLERIINAYRLTGRTIFEHREDLAVRFDVAYRGSCELSILLYLDFHLQLGKYYETKYLFLRRSPKDHHLHVWRHTLPPFIPIKKLESQHLKEDLTVNSFV
jgi:hypothetical protein